MTDIRFQTSNRVTNYSVGTATLNAHYVIFAVGRCRQRLSSCVCVLPARSQ